MNEDQYSQKFNLILNFQAQSYCETMKILHQLLLLQVLTSFHLSSSEQPGYVLLSQIGGMYARLIPYFMQ